MSGIIVVRQADAIHVVTDACTTRLEDGAVVAIGRKQTVTRNRVLVAGMGLWPPCVRLARLADERGMTFDEVANALPDLWRESLATVPDWGKAVRCFAMVAGWSQERQCLDVSTIETMGDGRDEVTNDYVIVYAGAPTLSSRDVVDTFVRRFCAAPETFDAHRDGVEFMETLRRHHWHQFEQAKRPAVGGFVQHTVLTRTSVTSRIIHHWPDRLGLPIEISDEVADPRQTRDEDFLGKPLAEIYAMREGLVSRMTTPADPSLTMTDVGKVCGVLAAGLTPEELAELHEGA